MNDIELRDDVAKQIYLASVYSNRDDVESLPSALAESCFILANAFMEARALHTKKMLDEMSSKRSYIGGSNE